MSTLYEPPADDGKPAKDAKTGSTEPAVTSSLWNLPNALTVLRIILVPVFAVLLLMHGGQDVALRLWALGVFVLAMLTDKLDGDIARKYNIVTNFGKLADPIADKALMATAFIGLAIIGQLPWWVPVIILVRELGITVLRMFMLKYQVMPASRGGKLKTALQTLTVAIYIGVVPLAAVASPGVLFAYSILAGFSLTLTILVTVFTGVDYLVAANKIKQEANAQAVSSADGQVNAQPVSSADGQVDAQAGRLHGEDSGDARG